MSLELIQLQTKPNLTQSEIMQVLLQYFKLQRNEEVTPTKMEEKSTEKSTVQSEIDCFFHFAVGRFFLIVSHPSF